MYDFLTSTFILVSFILIVCHMVYCTYQYYNNWLKNKPVFKITDTKYTALFPFTNDGDSFGNVIMLCTLSLLYMLIVIVIARAWPVLLVGWLVYILANLHKKHVQKNILKLTKTNKE